MYGDKLGVIPPMNNGSGQNDKRAQGKSQSASALNPKNSNVIVFPDRSQSPPKTAIGSLGVSSASADKIGGRDRD